MNKPSIETDEQAEEPIVIEIIESLDSSTRQRSRVALGLIRNIPTYCIHLKPDEFTIAPQKEPEEQPREHRPAQSSG
jgi:hypothetical protein